MTDPFARSLQENLLTLLAHSDEHGKLVAMMADAQRFDGDYRLIAERCVAYWAEHKEAPKKHTLDLFDDILLDKGNKRGPIIRKIVTQMLQLSEGINAAYVLKQLRNFNRLQGAKAAILEAADIIENDPQGLQVDRIEEIFASIGRARDLNFDTGVTLGDFEKVTKANKQDTDEFICGVPILDRHKVVPKRGSMLLLLAPKGIGKTWACVHIGKHGYRRKKKVLHLTLENSETDILTRYYQSLFALTKHKANEIAVKTMQFNSDDELIGFGEDIIEPDFNFDSPDVQQRLEHALSLEGRKIHNVIIKNFPERSLDINILRAFLDTLETVERFIPDMLIIDYPGKMKLDPKNYRLSLGHTVSEIRGLCQERNMACIIPHQASRKGAEARQVQATHASEDWSVIQTADDVITLTASEGERDHDLARLFVSHSRSERDGFGMVITQCYDIGQFCIESTYLKPSYFPLLDQITGRASDDIEEGDYDD